MTDQTHDTPTALRQPGGAPASLKKRSVVVAGHRTSVSLEAAFWETLRDCASAEGKTVNRLITEIDQGRSGNLSSAIRIFVLNTLLARSGAGQTHAHLTPGKD